MEPTPFADHYITLLSKVDYLPEATFTPTFHAFAERFNSLARYWAVGRAQQAKLMAELKSLTPGDDAAEALHESETLDLDRDAFPQTLRLSVHTMGFALVDELLRQLSKEMAPKEATAESSGPHQDLSFANRYMLLLTHQQGALAGGASAPEEAQAAERARQRVAQALERIGSTLLADLAEVKDQLATEARSGEELSDTDVEVTLDHLGQLVKACEKSYLEYLAKESA